MRRHVTDVSYDKTDGVWHFWMKLHETEALGNDEGDHPKDGVK